MKFDNPYLAIATTTSRLAEKFAQWKAAQKEDEFLPPEGDSHLVDVDVVKANFEKIQSSLDTQPSVGANSVKASYSDIGEIPFPSLDSESVQPVPSSQDTKTFHPQAAETETFNPVAHENENIDIQPLPLMLFEEVCEIVSAEDDKEKLDGLLDSLCVIMKALSLFPKQDREAAVREFLDSMTRRSRPIMTHHKSVAKIASDESLFNYAEAASTCENLKLSAQTRYVNKTKSRGIKALASLEQSYNPSSSVDTEVATK